MKIKVFYIIIIYLMQISFAYSDCIKYAVYDSDGIFIQYANDCTITTVPNNAVQLTDAQWEDKFNFKYDVLSGGVVGYSKPKMVSDILPNKINKVKEEALRRILLLIPGATLDNYIIKETNLLARVAELTRKEFKTTITTSELIELDWYDAIWQQIKAVKTASDSIEAEISALTTYDAVNNYNIETNPLWP